MEVGQGPIGGCSAIGKKKEAEVSWLTEYITLQTVVLNISSYERVFIN
jgi:hypothetical protein